MNLRAGLPLRLGLPAGDSGRIAKSEDSEGVVAEAYDKYAVAIYRFAFRRLGNRDDAEDVTSQVFLKAARGLDPSYDEAARRSWLYRAARTAIVDVWRSYGETSVIPLEWYVEEPPTAPAAQPSDAPLRVERILGRLNANQRRVLELRFLEGRSLLETAKELGMTEANVKVIQHRALRRAAELESERTDE
jgi:RNA polymerase sigma-70 factor (ECF subfamily)